MAWSDWIRLIVLLWAGSYLGPSPAWALRAAHTDAALVLGKAAVKPGGELWAGIRFRPDPHWHVYWRNPGDSGLAPTVKWSLPQAVRAGELRWPCPQRIEVGGLTSYGYEGEVTLLSPVTVSVQAARGNVVAKAHVDFLACQVECEPGSVEVAADLAVAGEERAAPQDSRLSIEQALSGLPIDPGAVPVSGRIKDGELVLKVSLPPGQSRSVVYFFPYSSRLIDHHAAQVVHDNELSIPLSTVADLSDRGVEGIILADAPILPRSGQLSAIVRFELPLPVALTPVTAPAADRRLLTLWLACLFALAGGVTLNLMPCVLPVLSLKILSLVKHGRDRGALLQNGLLYSAGVVASFIAIAGTMLALRALGTQVGWGFQFQSKEFVLAMIVVVVVFAMNLFGLFEISAPPVKGHETLGRWGAFGTGVLATVLATPCTAPFMGTAIGFALTQSTISAMLIFTCLGLGMALPYLLLTMFPTAIAFVPKPGPWMKGLKAVFGVALALTAVWLIWVLGGQSGACGVRAALLATAAAAWGAWAVGVAQRRSVRWLSVLGICGIILGLAAGTWSIDRCPVPLLVKATGGTIWQSFSEEGVAEARRAGKTVFVDFTAKWCLTCQVNDRTVLRHPRVLKALSRPDVAAFEADWTSFAPKITRALARFGRSSVPLYVVYRPGEEEPEVLPVVVTPEVVASALNASK
jgi:thiol:disulfide interchange protein DsbD